MQDYQELKVEVGTLGGAEVEAQRLLQTGQISREEFNKLCALLNRQKELQLSNELIEARSPELYNFLNSEV